MIIDDDVIILIVIFDNGSNEPTKTYKMMRRYHQRGFSDLGVNV